MKFQNYLHILFVIAIFYSLVLVRVHAQEESTKPVLFVEEGCPYCSKTKSFLEENGLDDVEVLDLREDPQNAEFYNTVCENAGIGLYDRGVPMLYDNGELITSADKIIEYIGNKYGVDVPDDALDDSSSNRIVFIILGFGLLSSLLFLILNKNK